MDSTFDLIDAQRRIRDINCPKKLFEAWERMSYAYLRRELNRYDLDEIQSVVWEQFAHIEKLANPCRPALTA